MPRVGWPIGGVNGDQVVVLQVLVVDVQPGLVVQIAVAKIQSADDGQNPVHLLQHNRVIRAMRLTISFGSGIGSRDRSSLT